MEMGNNSQDISSSQPKTVNSRSMNRLNPSKVLLILGVLFGFVLFGFGGLYIGLSINSDKTTEDVHVTEQINKQGEPKNGFEVTQLNCPQIDGQSNITDATKSYNTENLIPLESRITAAFRFLEESVLFYKYYPGASKFVSEKGYDADTGVQIPNIIHPDSKNLNLFIGKLLLPHVFSPYPPSTWGEQKIAPPLYSDFFGRLLVVGVNDKFYFLSGASCSYGHGICYQKLVSVNSKGYKIEDITVPPEYSPEIKTWTGGQEGGISNVNTFLEDLVEIKNNSIIFKTAKNNDKPSKYIVLDTVNNTWSETNEVIQKSIKYPYDVFRDHDCISYSTSLGDYIVKKDTSVEEGRNKIGLYFLKK